MPLATRMFYEHLHDLFGTSIDALGWTSESVQQTRFDVLEEAYTVPGTVLDVGCGHGDFSTRFDNYTGIDEVETSVAEARRRYPDKSFTYGDVLTTDLPTFNYVFASGVLGLHHPGFVLPIIKRMWELTEWVLAFNWYRGVDLDPDGLAGVLEPAEGVIVRADYLPEDSTIYLYKKDLPCPKHQLVMKLSGNRLLPAPRTLSL